VLVARCRTPRSAPGDGKRRGGGRPGRKAGARSGWNQEADGDNGNGRSEEEAAGGRRTPAEGGRAATNLALAPRRAPRASRGKRVGGCGWDGQEEEGWDGISWVEPVRWLYGSGGCEFFLFFNLN
jgi:hypothetical protein